MSARRPRSVPPLSGFGTAESRWARLGPYYAMFPIEFVRRTIGAFTGEGDTVIDPFCGRGSAPFVAMIAGRDAIGCDINPVAWVYASVKADPHPDPAGVIRRIGEIGRAVRPRDRKPSSEFQSLAYGPRALGFIKAARRELGWVADRVDRTVAALLLHYLHAKLGRGLSNQMHDSRAMSPGYAVRWWRERGLDAPDIDAAGFLRARAEWRYGKGVPARAGGARLVLGDAAEALHGERAQADLVLTSPPYAGVTNYRADSWLRLWALGRGPALPDWNAAPKYCNTKKYEAMLNGVLQATRERAREHAVWFLRVDARERTLGAVRRVMAGLLPGHRRYEQASPWPGRTQTALYGDSRRKPGEIDLVYLPPGRRKPGPIAAFQLARSAG